MKWESFFYQSYMEREKKRIREEKKKEIAQCYSPDSGVPSGLGACVAKIDTACPGGPGNVAGTGGGGGGGGGTPTPLASTSLPSSMLGPSASCSSPTSGPISGIHCTDPAAGWVIRNLEPSPRRFWYSLAELRYSRSWFTQFPENTQNTCRWCSVNSRGASRPNRWNSSLRKA